VKVLVIGAGGRVRSIGDLLIERGHEVRAASRIPEA
jgi:hypothetical protein